MARLPVFWPSWPTRWVFAPVFFPNASRKSGPAEALASAGAGRTGVICGAILPEAFPSFVATGLYAVEKSVRAAVVLGLVGAGGIGVELRSAMNLFQYPQALTVILLILVVVIGCEQVSSLLRKRLI